MYQVSSGSTQLVVIPVKINRLDIDMALDTGASVTLVNEEKFHQIQRVRPSHSSCQRPSCSLTLKELSVLLVPQK